VYARETQRITSEQRFPIIVLCKDRHSARFIAKHASRLLHTPSANLARCNAASSSGSGARSGRPRATAGATDAAIVAVSQADPFSSLRRTQALPELTRSQAAIDTRQCDVELQRRVTWSKRIYTQAQLCALKLFEEGYPSLGWTRAMCADQKSFYCDRRQD
jgi:hypothetical protein